VAAAGCLQRQAGLIGIGDGIGGDASSTLMPSDAHVDVHFLSIKTMGCQMHSLMFYLQSYIQ
jgi:hypothetical protein